MLWLLASGSTPFGGARTGITTRQVAKYKIVNQLPGNSDPAIRDFLLLMIQQNPDDRPTAAQLLQHELIKSHIPGVAALISTLKELTDD